MADLKNSPGADLRCADLRNLDLRGANFNGADLTGAWLHASDLTGATLVDANLEFAHLEGVVLRNADLAGAYLRRSVLRDADVYGANLDNADLCWVDVMDTRYLTAAQTDNTLYCRSTRLPDELEHPDDDFGWKFKPFFREPRENLVTINSLDGLSLIQYIDAFSSNNNGQVNLFDDLGTTIGVDVIGLDLVPRSLDASHRHYLSAAGVSAGLGFGSGQIGDATFTFVTTNAGVFVRPVSFLQLESGVAFGFTLNDTFDKKVDTSLYYGIRVSVRPLVDMLDDLAETLL